MFEFWVNIFKNTFKEAGDNKPLYTNNNLTVTEPIEFQVGQVYQVALWKNNEKVDKNGNPYISIKITEKEEEQKQVQQEPEQLPDDDINF